MSLTVHPEPTWTGNPENREPRLSVFNELPFSPTNLKMLIMRLIQWHFTNGNQLYNKSLKNLVWTSSPLTTKILITDSITELDVSASKRPSISLTTGETSPVDVYINPETLQVSIDGSPVEYPVYHKLIAGSFLVVCEGISAPEAEALAEEIFRLLIGFSPAIKADANLKDFSVVKMEGASKREKSSERHAARVTVTWNANAFFRVPQEQAW